MRDYLDNRPIKLSGPASRRPLGLALFFILIALVFIMGDHYGLLAPVRRPLEQVISPVGHQLTAVRDHVAGFWAGVSNVQQLRSENVALQQEVSRLQKALIDREQARVENEHLRRQLAIEQSQPWHLLGAEIAVRTPDAGRRSMLITRGSNHDVYPGMAVIGQTGDSPAALIGIVEAVSSHSASVLLITDFGCQVSARVLHEGQTALGLVQGQWQRGSRLRLEQVEREATLAAGDIVVSAGLTAELDLPLMMRSVPNGIPIGTVEAVSTEGHVQVAELRPYVDPDQVRYVWVVLSQND